MGKFVKLNTLCVEYTKKVSEIKTLVCVGKSANSIEEAKPYREEFVAVWDTGAHGTSITPEVARKLNLPQVSELMIQGVTGQCVCSVYLVSLFLPNGVIIPEIEVTECPGDIGCDVLIGMDVITQGDFAISHKTENTVFSFRIPGAEKIDFIHPETYGGNSLKLCKIKRIDPYPYGSGKKI